MSLGTLPSRDRPPVFGKRPHLSKEGRELANATARRIHRTDPNCVDDPDDPSLSEVLVYLERTDDDPREETTDTLADLLGNGLTFREAGVWLLYEHGGLTPREIVHADEGKERSFSREHDKDAVETVEQTLVSAAAKLGIELD